MSIKSKCKMFFCICVFIIIAVWVNQVTAGPVCWLPSLCGTHTRYSYSFPSLNQTEIRIEFFDQYIPDDENDNEVKLLHPISFVSSLCFQLELIQLYDNIDLLSTTGKKSSSSSNNMGDEWSGGRSYRYYDFNSTSTTGHLRTPIHCYDDITTEDLSLLVITLPYALVPGRYDMHIQMHYRGYALEYNERGEAIYPEIDTSKAEEKEMMLTKTLAYFIFPRQQPSMPDSRINALAPAYGSFARDHFHLSLYNNYHNLLISPTLRRYAPDTMLFNVHGMHQYLLQPFAAVASSKGGPAIEPGSWFFEITPIKLPGSVQDPAAAEQLVQDLHLDVPDAYISALNGQHIGPKRPQINNVVNFFHANPAEGYLEIVLNDEELADQRHFVRDHASYVSSIPTGSGPISRQELAQRTRKRIERELDEWENQMTLYFNQRLAATTSQPKRRLPANRGKINICIFGSSNMDGQKRIWLQQAESLDQNKFQFIWLMAEGDKANAALKNSSNSIFYHLNRLPHIKVANNTSNGYALSFDQLHQVPSDSFVTAAMVWEYNTTKLYQYIHQRYMKAGGDMEKLSPPFVRDFYQSFVELFEVNECDIAVYGNARGYNTDVFINDAARYLRIPTVTELLNLFLEPDILPDAIIAPSHHSWLHRSIQGPIDIKVKETGIRPMGFVIAPSMDPDHFDPEPYRFHVPTISPKNCEVAMGDSFRTQVTVDDFQNSFYKHSPCILIGFIARISGEKNPGLLLQAASVVLQRYPFARFRFIGEGAIKQDLMALAFRLGIEYAVEFIGWVSTDELPRYLADLDILVNPSLRGWSETFCISNIEAMSMELPLVTFAVGGIGEYVIAPNATTNPSGEKWRLSDNALIVDSANPLSFAEGIMHFIKHPDVAREVGRNGRKSLLEYFTVERQMQQYEGLYERLYRSSRNYRLL